MLTKELGRTGVFIPEVGIGSGNYHAGPEPLRCGLKAGARFIDTAESYGTEQIVGEALKGLPAGIFVATKVSPQNFGRTRLRSSVDSSLRRLGIDTIDLMQLHHPNPDPAVPLEETMDALSDLVDEGKVRFIGVSNFSLAQLEHAQRALRKYPVVSNQVRYNLLDRTIENDLLPYCQANGITIIAYSPLGAGVEYIKDSDGNGVLARLSSQLGKSAAQIALNWCLCKGSVVVIPRGSSEKHVVENCGASDWRLSAEHVALLDASVHYRPRGRFAALVKRCLPERLRPLAVTALNRLPLDLRQRLR